MTENYLQILEDSLHKKIKILKQIETQNKEQEASLSGEEVSMEDFEACVERKEVLILELNRLDYGFEQLYERTRQQLLNEREQHKAQIEVMQQLISQITDLSVSIQAQEMRNKKRVEEFFASARKEVRNGRIGSKVAYDYYKRMSNTDMVPPQFMDQKK